MQSNMSFMNITNSSGPRIDPWGTPEETTAASDRHPLITTEEHQHSHQHSHNTGQRSINILTIQVRGASTFSQYRSEEHQHSHNTGQRSIKILTILVRGASTFSQYRSQEHFKHSHNTGQRSINILTIQVRGDLFLNVNRADHGK